jgi:hypothetical protein
MGDNRMLKLPRVFTLEEGESLWECMCRAQDFFERRIADMNDVDAMVARVGRW